MRRSFYLFLFLYFFSTNGYAQNFNHKKTEILKTYDQIEIDDKEAVSADEIKKLYDESRKISFVEGEIRGLTLLQKVALMNGDYILSGKYSDQAEVLAKEQDDYNALSAIYLYRGKIHIILDKSVEAKADLQKALDFAFKIENQADQHIQLCRIYANLAGMSEGIGDNKNWYNYTVKSLEAIETTPAKNLTEYQKSKYYYLYIFELMNMGNYYGYAISPPKPELAEPYFKKMIAFENSAPEYFKILNLEANESMSSFYLVKGDYQKSIDYAQKVLAIEKVKSNHRERLMAYRNLKEAYRFLKNDTEENKYLRLYTKLNDSITFSEKKAIVRQSRDQIQKSDVKNEKSKRSFLLIGVGIILIIALISWLLVRRNNKILRRNYEQMIEKLKAQALTANDITQEYNEIEPLKNEDNDVFVNKNVISADTEARILRRLNAFEKSGKFLRKDLTMSMLSAQLNTNSKYLSEIIRDNKSQNFNNYLTNLRINYIVQKLYNEPRYRDYKISYLAEECGYASPQVFVLAFKKINGVTPSYFIDSLKEDENLIFN